MTGEDPRMRLAVGGFVRAYAGDAIALFREITLTFSAAGPLTGLDIVDDLDQRTAMVFRHGEVNPVLESGLFEFEVPAGVDVIGNLPDDVAAESAP